MKIWRGADRPRRNSCAVAAKSHSRIGFRARLVVHGFFAEFFRSGFLHGECCGECTEWIFRAPSGNCTITTPLMVSQQQYIGCYSSFLYRNALSLYGNAPALFYCPKPPPPHPQQPSPPSRRTTRAEPLGAMVRLRRSVQSSVCGHRQDSDVHWTIDVHLHAASVMCTSYQAVTNNDAVCARVRRKFCA